MDKCFIEIEYQSLPAFTMLRELANQALPDWVLLPPHEEVLSLAIGLLFLLGTHAVRLSLALVLLGLLLLVVMLLLLLVGGGVLLLEAGG